MHNITQDITGLSKWTHFVKLSNFLQTSPVPCRKHCTMHISLVAYFSLNPSPKERRMNTWFGSTGMIYCPYADWQKKLAAVLFTQATDSRLDSPHNTTCETKCWIYRKCGLSVSQSFKATGKPVSRKHNLQYEMRESERTDIAKVYRELKSPTISRLRVCIFWFSNT